MWRLPALRARPPRLFVVDHAAFSRPGPRVVDGVETLAALLHPAALPPALVASATAGAMRLVAEPEADGPPALLPPYKWRFEPLQPLEAGVAAPAPASPTAMPESSLPTLAPSSLPAMPPTSMLAPPPSALSPPPPTPAVASAPAVRSAASLVHTDDGRLIVFGGEAAVDEPRERRGLKDVWSLGAPPSGWAACSCPTPSWEAWQCGATANEDVPTARSNHAAAACGGHLLVFGGWSAGGDVPLAHPELLHLETRCWTHCSTHNAPPPPRGNPTLAYSPARHLAVLYGGWDGSKRFDDVWCLDMEAWRWHRAATACDGPSPRTDHAAVLWDAGGGDERLLVFGGSTGRGSSDELWSLDCSGGEPARWRWARFGAAATAADGAWPPPRSSHAAALAGSGPSASLVVVGGQDGGRGGGPVGVVADAWVLSPLGGARRTWSRLDWRGTFPLQRCRHSVVVVGELAVVYGGYDGARTLDAHHSLFCAPLAGGGGGGVAASGAAAQGAGGWGGEEARLEVRRRQQERWAAEQPLTEVGLAGGWACACVPQCSFTPLAVNRRTCRPTSGLAPRRARCRWRWPRPPLRGERAAVNGVSSRLQLCIGAPPPCGAQPAASRHVHRPGHRLQRLHAGVPQAAPLLRERLQTLPVGARERAWPEAVRGGAGGRGRTGLVRKSGARTCKVLYY